MQLIEEAEKLARDLEPFRIRETGDASKVIRALVDKLKESEKLQETNYELQSFNNTNLEIINGKDEAIAELVKALSDAADDCGKADMMTRHALLDKYRAIAKKYELKE